MFEIILARTLMHIPDGECLPAVAYPVHAV